jgi:hypothetical protein
MAQKVLALDLTSGRVKQSTGTFVEYTDTHTSPTASGIPRADGSGTISADWIPDSIRTINIREADGDPSLTDITDIVVGNGDLSYVGGGVARLKTAADATVSGGGGASLTVQTSSLSVSNVVTIVVPDGTLTDNGSGEVELTIVSSGGGSGTLSDLATSSVMKYAFENFL